MRQHTPIEMSPALLPNRAGDAYSVSPELQTHYLSQFREALDQLATNTTLCATTLAQTHDRLTGLPNRDSFETTFAELTAERDGETDSIAIILCDVDQFKAINDSHGKDTGDRLLCVVAATLLAATRDTDTVASRLQGDEAIIVIPSFVPRNTREVDMDFIRRLQLITSRLRQELPVRFGLALYDYFGPEKARELMRTAPRLGITVGGALWTPDISLSELLSHAEETTKTHKEQRKQAYLESLPRTRRAATQIGRLLFAWGSRQDPDRFLS